MIFVRFWGLDGLVYVSPVPSLLWFRNDLRFADNAALAAAVEAGGPLIPVFIWDADSYGAWVPGAASRWWLHQALESLQGEFRSVQGELVLRQGNSLAVLRELVRETGARRIFWNRRYESPLRELDVRLKHELYEAGVEVMTYNSALLNEPWEVSTKAGQPYKVFTPYFNAVAARRVADPVVSEWGDWSFPECFPRSEPLAHLGLMPEVPWYRGFASRWEPSEAGALKQLGRFLDEAVDAYERRRDRPDDAGTSGLSPYLHFGQIGPRQIVHALNARGDPCSPGAEAFLREIYWREFAYHVLYHFPSTPDAPLKPEYAHFPWEQDPELLRRWQRGQTGYPIVDAGMRQLWETGWMHNRVRMIVASLLVKHLLQDWKEGAKWFWETLVDADLASNTLGWQWSGGCGADAAPYFRIFNPILQGKKFDPEGDYVRRYVPELAELPIQYLHTPWQAPPSVLASAGIVMGETYPNPVIDHAAGRARALAAFDQFRNPVLCRSDGS